MKDQIKNVLFFKLGGTWDMITKDGKMEGEGGLDDSVLKSIENDLGYYKENADYNNLEWKLAQKIESIILKNGKKSVDIALSLSWLEDINKFLSGKFISLFSGDSSHFRTALIAPLVAYLLQQAKGSTDIAILGAQGTDTADIALLPLLDVYTFDTNFPPFLFTGSNKSYWEKNSDAPRHFYDLVRIANKKLPSGAYWIFSGNLFQASDLVKISPLDSRIVDNFSTFYSPHLKAEKVEDVLNSRKNNRYKVKVPENHIVNITTTEKLYHAIKEVHIVDLSEQNELKKDIEEIVDPKFKAVVIAGHSFGNVSHPIKYACIQAVLNNKIVIVASRCFIADINQRYGASLLTVNTNELRSKGKKIISARKLNRNIAKALAVRAVQEGLDSIQTESLFTRYTIAKGLSEQDMITI